MLTFQVYSAPKGVFKAHVDTPRSETQFGSLVVCLPSGHEGGALVLRHDDRSVQFDWSGPAPDKIQWAAFYSDCEHEVMPLISGHRITLTYNLYYQTTQPQSGWAVPIPVQSFPVYLDLQAALQNSGFMKRGGILGFYCSHAYPHSNTKLRKELPVALKGVDLLIFTVCRSLGLQTKARPIIEFDKHDNFDADVTWSDEDCFGENFETEVHKNGTRRLGDFQNHGFHIPPYNKKHRISSESYIGQERRQTDVNLENILPQYRNETGDPAKHPLAQHELTLKYRTLGRELEMQHRAYAPTEAKEKIEYLKAHVEVVGLVPPSKDDGVRVGSKFHGVKMPKYEVQDKAVSLSLVLSCACLRKPTV
jgi:hypothetical protein